MVGTISSIRKKMSRGFTLVELLVVISIIALLISILLPSLQKARQQARAVVCASHCKQMGNGAALYYNEYGMYPAHQIRMREYDPTLPYDIRVRWFDSLAMIMSSGKNIRPRDMSDEDWVKYKEKNAFFDMQKCPSVARWAVGRNNSYGYNYKYIGSTRDNADPRNPYAPKERFPVRQVRSASMTIAFGDCDGTGWTEEYAPDKVGDGLDPYRIGNHGYTLDPTYIPVWSDQTYSGGEQESYAWHNWRTYLSDRHMGKSEVAYVDGHAEMLEPKKAYRNNALWNGLGLDPGVREDGTQDTSHKLYDRDPHVSTKLDEGSGQEWRYE